MSRIYILIAALAVASMPARIIAAEPVILVENATGGTIESLSIRRVGSAEWRDLGAGAASGGSGNIRVGDSDCAFDLRATMVGGEQVIYNRVNLCGVSRLTLQRRGPDAWVEYD